MKRVSVLFLTVFLFNCISVFALDNVAEDFTKSTPKDTTLFFTADEFIKSCDIPEGKSLVSIKFNQVTNAQAGNLKIKNNIVSKGSTVSINDLNNLTFVPVASFEGEAIFTWTANYGGVFSPFPAAVVITIGSGVVTPSVIEENKSEEVKKENKEEPEIKNPVKTENKKDKIEKITNKKKETVKTIKTVDHTKGLKPLRYEDMLTHWGAYSAGMLASRGYVIGEDYGNNFYFRPDEKITRLDFLLMVNSIFGINPKDSLENNPFSDKNVPSYIMRAAISAYEYDIIDGTKGKDGKIYLYPYDPITRAEAITIVDYALRLDSYGVDEAEFKDVNKIPEWAMQSVKNLEAYGIIQGYEDGTLRPNAHITRAQAAETVWQALKFLDLKKSTNAVFKTIVYGD